MTLFLKYDNNLLDYGYYQVGDSKFLVKNDALMYASRTNQEVYWNFHDEHFSKFDWTKEPERDLDDLYKERALSLRNRYDHLVLHFSGGPDSINILETFIKHKIHLDEVLMRGPNLNEYDPKDGVLPRNNFAEIKASAIPIAQMVKETVMPHLKITIVDIAKQTLDWFSRNKSWLDDYTWLGDPTALVRSNFDVLDNRLIKLAESGKKIAHITGHEKPEIRLESDGSYYSYFYDFPLSKGYVSPRIEHTALPYYFEFFYWHKDCAEMTIKQSHLIMNAIKQGLIKDFEAAADHSESETMVLRQAYTRKRSDILATVLYKNKIIPPWQSYKMAEAVMIGEDHSWLFDHFKSDALHNWKKNILGLHSMIDKRFHKNGKFFIHGAKSILSKGYRLD